MFFARLREDEESLVVGTTFEEREEMMEGPRNNKLHIETRIA